MISEAPAEPAYTISVKARPPPPPPPLFPPPRVLTHHLPQVLSGQCLPKPGHETEGEIIDPFVVVRLRHTALLPVFLVESVILSSLLCSGHSYQL
jgi:hypothetical protein